MSNTSLAAQAVANGPMTAAPPSFDGHGWLVVINLAGMTTCTLLAVMVRGRGWRTRRDRTPPGRDHARGRRSARTRWEPSQHRVLLGFRPQDRHLRHPRDVLERAVAGVAYTRLSQPETKRPSIVPGSFAALVAAYRATPDFAALELSTRTNQLRYLDMIIAEIGDRSVKGIRPIQIYTMRDRMADMPGKANAWLSCMRALLAYATRIDMRTDNPASGIKRLEIGEHEPWPADLLRVALEEATPMTRLAIVTGLCSGQRVSDCIRMQYGWIDGGIIELVQKKTKKDVAIPMHGFWLDELKALPRRSITLLYERTGVPFGTTGAIQKRLRDLMAKPAVREVHADLVARELITEDATFSFHGLRKNACCYLLELGLSDTEVGSILGMSTEMVRHYGKRARALMIARGAAERVTAGRIVPMNRASLPRAEKQA